MSGAEPPTPAICLHGVYKYNFTLTFTSGCISISLLSVEVTSDKLASNEHEDPCVLLSPVYFFGETLYVSLRL